MTGTRSVPSLPRLPAAGVIAVASLVAGVIVVMTLSGTSQAQAPNPAPDAQAPQSTQYAEAAPKQQQPAPKQQAQAPKPAQIDRNGVLILIRSALLALDQANKTGNYTVLRDLGAPDFAAHAAAADRSQRHDAHGRLLSIGADAGEFRAGLRAGGRSLAAIRDIGLVRPGSAGGAAAAFLRYPAGGGARAKS